MPPEGFNAEPIYQALQERITSLGLFTKVSRRFRHFSNVDPKTQPACFIVGQARSPIGEIGEPQLWRLLIYLVIYYRLDADRRASPDTAVNEIVKRIEEAMFRQEQEGEPENPDNPLYTTLEGQALYAWITGQVFTGQRLEDQQGIIAIPIEVISERTVAVT